jgi:hypothetical protein
MLGRGMTWMLNPWKMVEKRLKASDPADFR